MAELTSELVQTSENGHRPSFWLMDALGYSSYLYYRGLVGRIENAGGIDAFSQQKGLQPQQVRKFLFSVSCVHAGDTASKSLSEHHLSMRRLVLQQGFNLVFTDGYGRPAYEPLLSLWREDGLFTKPNHFYNLSDLVVLSNIEYVLQPATMWDVYDYIARTRSRQLMSLWEKGEEARVLFIEHGLRTGIGPNKNSVRRIQHALKNPQLSTPISDLVLRIERTMYRDQLHRLFVALAGDPVRSTRISEVLTHQLVIASNAQVTGITIYDDGKLDTIDLMPDKNFIECLIDLMVEKQLHPHPF